MSSRLSVIFYIILCLEIGFVLAVLPWVPSGWLGLSLSDWGNNYFLLLASQKAGYGLQRFVASGWVRGAVSGIGLLNIGMGFWEIINFRHTIHALDLGPRSVESSSRPVSEPGPTNDSAAANPDPLSDYPRRNH